VESRDGRLCERLHEGQGELQWRSVDGLTPCDLTWRYRRRSDAFTEGTVTEARSDDGVRLEIWSPYSPIFYLLSCMVPTFQLMFTSSILELIPYLPDDPKSQFIGEVMDSPTTVSTTVVLPSHRIDEHGTSQPTSNDASAILSTLNEPVCVDPLGSVSIEEFWERMAFRQECSLGAVVAFFVVYVHTPPFPHLTDSTAILPRSTI